MLTCNETLTTLLPALQRDGIVLVPGLPIEQVDAMWDGVRACRRYAGHVKREGRAYEGQPIIEDGLTGISLIEQNSPDGLRTLLQNDELDPRRTLFFLDAHWFPYWPLLDEIAAIPRGAGIIVLHDVRVPDCPGLGFDTYHGHELSYDYVRAALTEWSPDHCVLYNDESAEGSRRGAMVVYPRP